MIPRDPNVARVELVAEALGELRRRLVFVGGCAVGLLVTDKAAAPVRVTVDVDLVVQATALSAYHKIEAEFQHLGFRRDMSQDAPICRWVYEKIAVDLMPTDAAVLGFSNRWYPVVFDTAREVKLPSGTIIQLIHAPVFLATKFEAFANRGNRDLLASHDLEDILNVVDGRRELPEEIATATAELRKYLAEQCGALLAMPNFVDYLPGLLNDNDSPPLRADAVHERIRAISMRGN